MANPTGAIPGARAEEPVTPINNGETTSLITDLTGRLRVRIAATGANGIPIDIFSGVNGGMQMEDAVASDALNGVNAVALEALAVQQHGPIWVTKDVPSPSTASPAANAVVLKGTPGRLYKLIYVNDDPAFATEEYVGIYPGNFPRLVDAAFPIPASKPMWVAPFGGSVGTGISRVVVEMDFMPFGIHFNPGLMVGISQSPTRFDITGAPSTQTGRVFALIK